MNTPAKHAALQQLEQIERHVDSWLSYESNGSVLLIATVAQLEQLLPLLTDEISEHIHLLILLTDRCLPKLKITLKQAEIPYLDLAKHISIQGYMGEFTVDAQYQQPETPAAPKSEQESEQEYEKSFVDLYHLKQMDFDLVLDLQTSPAITAELPPPGYFASHGDAQLAEQLFLQLSEWIGVFDKPKYFNFLAERCAHNSTNINGCSRCIAACPSEAITTQNNAISVDPYLCQGCGDCSTVCPSGAMLYRYPPLTQTLLELRKTLDTYYQAGGSQAVLLFYHPENNDAWLDANRSNLPDNYLPYPVESVSATGLDVWLPALACGAASIVILTSAQDELNLSLQLLDQQLEIAAALLSGLGVEENPLLRCEASALMQRSIPSIHIKQRAVFAGSDDKRRMIRTAMTFLSEHLSRNPINPPASVQALPSNALFGEILLDADSCTLCMSCVSLCPQAALLTNDGLPQLNFIEANCVQCSICVNGCPETALQLNPRYLYDEIAARETRTLHQDEVVGCVQCGKPFAGAGMLQAMFEKLGDHPMYQGENKSLLQMCSDCRVIALHQQQQQ